MKLPDKIVVTGFLLAFMVIGMAVMRPQDEFKNLKVLPKNISEDSLMSIMENYERSLGVNCSHCHVVDSVKEDYASDAIHDKETCRDMMRMTDSINRAFFPPRNPKRAIQQVTCYTCHRGQTRPEREVRIKN